MKNINIDVEALKTQLEKLKSVEKKLEEIFTNVMQNNDALKDYWSTKTSESVFGGFEQFKKTLEQAKTNFLNDISFLQNVIDAYEKEENAINNLVDTNIAI